MPDQKIIQIDSMPIFDLHIHPIMQNPIDYNRLTRARRYPNMMAIVLMFGLLTGCKAPDSQQPGTVASNPSQASTTNEKKAPKVLVTNTVLCDLTKQIAASTIDLVCLLTPGSDPHIYKLTPAARQSIEQAQLILYGGYDFEPELIKAIKSSSNPAPKVAVHEVAVPQPQQFEEDGKSTTDPHVWHNAQNGAKIVAVIEANLEKLVPAQAAIYQQNTQKLTTEITQIDTWIRSQINTIPIDQKILFTTHDALGYYSKAYGIPVDALEGVSTEEKPNAARAKELIDKIKKTKVSTIYVESTLNPQLIKAVAQAAKVKVSEQEIYADGLGEISSSGETYQKMLISNTKSIVEGLGGKYRPF
jgi:manganese/iron transport system substrate-binding protein